MHHAAQECTMQHRKEGEIAVVGCTMQLQEGRQVLEGSVSFDLEGIRDKQRESVSGAQT